MVPLGIHEFYVTGISSLPFRRKFFAKSGPVSRSRAGNPPRRLSGFIGSAFEKPMAVDVTKGSNSRATIILTSGASGRISALFSLQVLRSLWVLVHAFVLLFLLPFQGRWRMAPSASASQDEKGGDRKGSMVRVPTMKVARKCGMDQDVSSRRALAIRRVMHDVDDQTVRQFSLFVTPKGDTLFTQSWTPVSGTIRGIVIILHGLNEHSGRYSDFAKKLNANGFKVYGMDWIGHGGSDGLHAYVHSLDDAVSDTKLFLLKVLADNNDNNTYARPKCFLFGHSTGGAIVLKAALDPKVSALISGIILTSPAVGVQPSHPLVTALAPLFSMLLPRYQWSAANKRGVAVSRDPEALATKYSDPLVFTGSIRVRTGYEILLITTFLQRNLSRLTAPFLVLHGTSDLVTDPEASKRLYEEASSADKTIKLYDGLLHDLLFEPEKEEVANDIILWLNRRL